MKKIFLAFVAVSFFLGGKTICEENSMSKNLYDDADSSSIPYVESFFKKSFLNLKEGQTISLDYFKGIDTADVRYSREDSSRASYTVRVLRQCDFYSYPVQGVEDKLIFVVERFKILDSGFVWNQTDGNSCFLFQNKIIDIFNEQHFVSYGDGLNVEDSKGCFVDTIAGHEVYVFIHEFVPSVPPDGRSYSYFTFNSSGQMQWFMDSTHSPDFAEIEKENHSLLLRYSFGCLYLNIPIKFNFKQYTIEFNVKSPFFENSGSIGSGFHFYDGEIKLYSKPNEKSKFKTIKVTEKILFEVLKVSNKDYLNGFDGEKMWYLIQFNGQTGWVKYSEEIQITMGCG